MWESNAFCLCLLSSDEASSTSNMNAVHTSCILEPNEFHLNHMALANSITRDEWGDLWILGQLFNSLTTKQWAAFNDYPPQRFGTLPVQATSSHLLSSGDAGSQGTIHPCTLMLTTRARWKNGWHCGACTWATEVWSSAPTLNSLELNGEARLPRGGRMWVTKIYRFRHEEEMHSFAHISKTVLSTVCVCVCVCVFLAQRAKTLLSSH